MNWRMPIPEAARYRAEMRNIGVFWCAYRRNLRVQRWQLGAGLKINWILRASGWDYRQRQTARFAYFTAQHTRHHGGVIDNGREQRQQTSRAAVALKLRD